MAKTYVNYGDYIMLLAEDLSSYLMSPGFVDTAVVVQEATNLDLTPNMRAMLFTVIPRLSYDASEHPSFMESGRRESGLDNAENKKRKEADQEKTLKARSGEPIKYGQKLQFRHVKSQMVLRATVDNDDPRLELSEQSDDSCLFKLVPKSNAMLSEVRVAYGDPVSILSSKIWKYIQPHSQVDQTRFLHFSVNFPSHSAPIIRKASLSTVKMLWSCVPYSFNRDNSAFKGGDIVRIRHSIDKWCLANEGKHELLVHGQDKHALSSSLFILETADSDLRGKACTLKTRGAPSKFRLRHLITSRLVTYNAHYQLTLESEEHKALEHQSLEDGASEEKWSEDKSLEERSAITFELKRPSPNDEGQMSEGVTRGIRGGANPFELEPTSASSEECLRSCGVFKIKIKNRSLTTQGEFRQECYSASGLSTVNCYKLSMLDSASEDTFCIESSDAVRVKEFEMVLSTKLTLMSFAKAFINKERPSQELYQRLNDVLTKLILYITESEEQPPFMSQSTPCQVRQQNIRELGILQLLHDILYVPFTSGNIEFDSIERDQGLTHICKQCYFLINLSVRGCSANQFYCAQWVPLYLDHCEAGKEYMRIVPILAELVEANKALQEQLDIPSIIERFINLCIERGKHASYIHLLISMYACYRSADKSDVIPSEGKVNQLFMQVQNEGEGLQVNVDGQGLIGLAEFETYSAETDNGELFRYFLALLEMAAELASNPKAHALKSVYSLDICYACTSNVSLNYEIRTRFVRIITQLHIRTLQKLELPNRTRYWREVQQDAQLTCSKLPLSPDLQRIQTFVHKFLVTEGEFVADQAKSNLIKEVLLLVKCMVAHGLYKTTSDLSYVLKPLIRLLSANSLVQRVNSSPHASTRKLRSVVHVNNQLQRYSNMESMQTINKIIKKVLQIKSDTQLTQFITAYKSSPLDSRLTDDFNGISELTGQVYEVDAELRPALSWLREILQDEKMDLVNINANHLVAVMLSLVMQKDPELLKTVLKVIRINFTQVSTLTKNLCCIELKSEAEEMMLKAKKLLSELNSYAERVNTWLGNSQDELSSQRVPEILVSLATLCSKTSLEDKSLYDLLELIGTGKFTEYKPPTLAPSYHPSQENQRLLLNMKAHHPILILIAYRGQGENYRLDLHLKVLRCCYIFLAKLCYLEPSIQAELHMYLPYFEDDIATHVFALDLIKEIFRSNSYLTENVSQELLRTIAQVLKLTPMSAKKTSILHSFLTFLRCDGKIVRTNRSKVLDALSQGDKEMVVKTYTSPEDLEILEGEIRSVILKPSSVSADLSYLLTSLEVLADSADRKKAADELTCRDILPIPDFIKLLKVTSRFWPLKQRLVQFYQHVYLDVEQTVEGIEVVQVLEVLRDDLALILDNRRSLGDVKYRVQDTTKTMQEFAEEYAYCAVVPCITQLLRAHIVSDQSIVEVTGFAITLHQLTTNPAYRQTSSRLLSLVKAKERVLALLPVTSADYVRALKERSVDKPKALTTSPGDPKQISFRHLVKKVKECAVIDHASNLEFEELVSSFINIKEITTKAFGYNYTLENTQVIAALISANAPQSSQLDHKCTAMSLRVLRRIIEMENRTTFKPAAEWGIAAWHHCRSKVLLRQNFLAELDVVQLLCDLMVMRDYEDISREVVLCAIAMLLGGNRQVQGRFYKSLMEDSDNKFMTTIRDQVTRYFEESQQLFNEIMDGAKFSQANFKQVHKVTQFATGLLRFLQLLCQGHNAEMQIVMKTQRKDADVRTKLFALIDIIGEMLGSYITFMHKDNISLGIQIIETLIEYVQGPCRDNQRVLIQLGIFDRVNDLQTCLRNSEELEMRGFKQDYTGRLNASSIEEIGKLSTASATFLVALLDGNADADILHRISTPLNFSQIKERMFQVFAHFIEHDLGLHVAAVTFEQIRDRLTKDSFKGNIEEGFNLYILMHKITDHYPPARSYIKKSSFIAEEFFAFKFFKRYTGRIEVVVEGVLQRTYFPIQPICLHISKASKKNTMLTIDRSDPYNKIFDLLAKVPDLLSEMKHNARLEHRKFRVTAEKVSRLRDMAMILVLLINYLLIFYYHNQERDNAQVDVPSAVNTAVFALGVAQLAFSSLVLVGWGVLKAELVIRRGWRLMRANAIADEQNEDEADNDLCFGEIHLKVMPKFDKFIGIKGFSPFKVACLSLSILLRDNTFTYYCLIVILGTLGLQYPIAYSILLLDVVYRFPTLRSILDSVVAKGKQLLLTAMLGLIILYIYAFWGFTVDTDMYFDDTIGDYGEDQCQSLWMCFLTTVNRGLRPTGGIYDVMEIVPYDKLSKYYTMFLFSLSFFLVVNIILLNIVFGIIIDTFAQLRDQRNAIEKDMKTKCLICNLDRNKFDNSSRFRKHITEDHNVWQYVYFIVYLQGKDDTEYNGIESYCSEMIAAQEISWIPQHQALCLRNSEKAEENTADHGRKVPS
jgi:hypothetical protein